MALSVSCLSGRHRKVFFFFLLVLVPINIVWARRKIVWAIISFLRQWLERRESNSNSHDVV